MAGLVFLVARKRRIRRSDQWTCCSNSSSGIGSSSSSSSSSSSLAKSRVYQVEVDDEKLAPLAREAKDRLHHRLTDQTNPLTTTRNYKSETSKGSMMNRRRSEMKKLKTEVFRGKKRLLMRWAMGRWKLQKNNEQQDDQEESCAVCLEEFQERENVVNLACTHKFHSTCLAPWLQTNAICPCCRISIFTSP